MEKEGTLIYVGSKSYLLFLTKFALKTARQGVCENDTVFAGRVNLSTCFAAYVYHYYFGESSLVSRDPFEIITAKFRAVAEANSVR